MMNQKNKRMTALDPEILYDNAQREGVQFYQYNEWVTKKGTQVLFEGMFLKKQQTLARQSIRRPAADSRQEAPRSEPGTNNGSGK